MRARKLLIIVALVGIGAAACGSSSKTASTSSPTTAASSGTPTTASGTPSTGGKSYSGSSSGSFCDAVRNDANTFKGATPKGTTPTDLKALYGNVLPALEKAQSKAPSAIKDDFGTFISAFKQVNSCAGRGRLRLHEADREHVLRARDSGLQDGIRQHRAVRDAGLPHRHHGYYMTTRRARRPVGRG